MCNVLVVVKDNDLRTCVSSALTKTGHKASIVSSGQDALFAMGAVNAQYDCIVVEDDGLNTRGFICRIRDMHSRIGIIVITPSDKDTVEEVLKGLDVYSVIGSNQVQECLDNKIKKACSFTELTETGLFNIKRSLSEAAQILKETQAKLTL